MVLAIEADRASYHSQPSARNRDRLRQEHLERLGWHFHRIWSQEWFLHREREVDRAVAAYKAAVDALDHPQSMGPGAVATSDTPVRSRDDDRQVRDIAGAPVADEPSRRTGYFPVPRHLPIGEYTLRELVAVVRWVESDTLLRTDEDLFDEVLHELGFQRRGKRITEAIQQAIAIARRR